MKTLIYDNECPLCAAYTNAFVKTGMLEKEGRKSFDEVSDEVFNRVDKTKCNNEIPLVDTETGKTWYGIDALLELMGARVPIIKKVGEWSPINWFLKRLYKLISYNRKTIVALQSRTLYDCSPAFNIKYQLLFLLTGLLLNSALWQVYLLLFQKINPVIDEASWIIGHYGVVAINIAIATRLGWKKGLAYLGQVNMIALIAMLTILPLYFLSDFFNIHLEMYWFALGLCCFFIGSEYIRRMKYAGILKQPSVVILNVLSIASAIAFIIF